MASNEDIRRALGMLSAIFTDVQFGDEQDEVGDAVLSVYVETWRPLARAHLFDAVKRYLSSDAKFFPKPGEIVSLGKAVAKEQAQKKDILRRKRERLDRIRRCPRSHQRDKLKETVTGELYCAGQCGYIIPKRKRIQSSDNVISSAETEGG